MRILGLDVGTRRIGAALSDPLGLTAQRLGVIERRSLARDIEAVGALARDHSVETIVVGLPVTLRGRPGPQAQRVRAFGQALGQALNRPVVFVDERFTTAQGERALRETETARRRRKELADQVAAQLILQQYLETHRMRRAAPSPS